MEVMFLDVKGMPTRTKAWMRTEYIMEGFE